MKTVTSTVFALALTAFCCAFARADVSNLEGVWQGSGSAYDLQGNVLGTYQVKLDDQLVGPGTILSKITVILPNAPTQNFEQTIQGTPKGFSIQSDYGNGGGLCMTAGLCEGYVGSQDGDGVALTIIHDDADHFRIVKTELLQFHAVRMMSEKYERQTRK